jgi:hypothetical protein
MPLEQLVKRIGRAALQRSDQLAVGPRFACLAHHFYARIRPFIGGLPFVAIPFIDDKPAAIL